MVGAAGISHEHTVVMRITYFLTLVAAVSGVRRLPSDEAIVDSSQQHQPAQDYLPHDASRRLTTLAAAVNDNNIDDDDDDNEEQSRQQQQQQQSPRDTANTRTAAETNPDMHLVTNLPLLPEGLLKSRHWAGHLPAKDDGSDKKLFYWLFEPSEGGDVTNDNSDDTPLILWLNGGPGCSSMDGLFLENGPLRLKLKDDGEWTIDLNEYSWHNAPAWTLYVDQPVGTGLSYSKKKNWCKDDFMVNRDFHYFLEEFFLLHKDKFLMPIDDLDDPPSSPATMMVRRPFYFSGESHAGHYIPSMMDFILSRNDGKILPTDTNGLHPLRVYIPCSGAAIGNGWVDPYHQYSAAGAAYGAGIIGTAQSTAFDAKEHDCQTNLKSGNYYYDGCFDLLDEIIDQSGGKNLQTKVSQYDTRLWETKGQPRSFPLGHKEVETYLGGAHSGLTPPLTNQVNYHDVLSAIHATESIDAGQTYRECTDPPYIALQHQDGLGVVDELVRILDHESKPHMLLFNGMNDLICNHVGNEKLLDSLPWSKAKQFTQQPRYAWESGVDPSKKINYIPGRPDGYIKTFENLSFLKVLESGHMVPMDQPAIALVMMKTLVYGARQSPNGFLSSMQDLDRFDPTISVTMCALDACPNCLSASTSLDDEEDKVINEFNMASSHFTLIYLGMILIAFIFGSICTCFFQRTKRAAEHRRILSSLGDDMELTDQDSIYRDSTDDDDRNFT